MSFNTFKDKNILITGHTGFKGSWLSLWLNYLGANVVGFSIDEVGEISNYRISHIDKLINDKRGDIASKNEISKVIKDFKPDFIFHLAAQSLVRESYKFPLKTMMTNAIGSANILDSLRDIDQKIVIVMITSDKVYDNVEWNWGYREDDTIGGKDPYSSSKGMAELAIKCYLNSYFKLKENKIAIGVARAGNVIGGGDWAKDRIVPDCMTAWSINQQVEIRNPSATRPWQHVLEPLSGYLKLAESLYHESNHGEVFNFGPSSDQTYSVQDLLVEMAKHWDKVSWNHSKLDNAIFHEAGLLKLNCDKALALLKWRPTLNFEETVKYTVDWYKTFYKDGGSMQNFSISQIEDFMGKMNYAN